MKENDFKNEVYAAIINECTRLEYEGIYRGNAHHLAQRLCILIWDKFKREDL